MPNTPPTPWQVGLPLDQVLLHSPSGPSRPYVLPPSALSCQHVKTSHEGSLIGVEYLIPIRGIHQERALHQFGALPL